MEIWLRKRLEEHPFDLMFMIDDINVETFNEVLLALSGSYGASPYTLAEIPFTQLLENYFRKNNINIAHGHFLLAIFTRADYSLRDLEDFIRLSHEYSGMEEEQQAAFLADRMSGFQHNFAFQHWVDQQASSASGIVRYVAQKNNLEIRHVQEHLLAELDSLVSRNPYQKLFDLAILKRKSHLPARTAESD